MVCLVYGAFITRDGTFNLYLRILTSLEIHASLISNFLARIIECNDFESLVSTKCTSIILITIMSGPGFFGDTESFTSSVTDMIRFPAASSAACWWGKSHAI